MMHFRSSCVQLRMPSLPLYMSACSKKEKLYNDFTDLLKENFPAYKAHSSGRNFTRTVVDCLWYVDGHHDTLQKQSCLIPQLFQHLVYNAPDFQNTNHQHVFHYAISTLASTLFQNLQGSLWSHALLQRL